MRLRTCAVFAYVSLLPSWFGVCKCSCAFVFLTFVGVRCVCPKVLHVCRPRPLSIYKIKSWARPLPSNDDGGRNPMFDTILRMDPLPASLPACLPACLSACPPACLACPWLPIERNDRDCFTKAEEKVFFCENEDVTIVGCCPRSSQSDTRKTRVL